MTDLIKLGFSTENDGVRNREILSEAARSGGDIRLDTPGIYPLADTVFLYDDTSLYFGAGVYLKRVYDGVDHGSLFVNEGALRSEWNKSITITGMKVINDGVYSSYDTAKSGKGITGLRAIIALSYVSGLVIRDFETLDLPAPSYGIQVCTFENLLIENVHIEGKKDGIHLGRGKNFAIRHGYFRTYDDPIALNAHDYSTACPQLGWIENGVIEDCHDLDDIDTVGYFCRILAGSWVAWFEGMTVQHSDTVVSDGRVYRVIMQPDGTNYVSCTPPTHEKGSAVLDGIRWDLIQKDEIYSCGCKNIHFKDIFLHKKRDIAFSVHFDTGRWSRSYYPYSVAPVQKNLIFENVVYENDISTFISAVTPVTGIKIINSSLASTDIHLSDIKAEGLSYPKADILFSGCNIEGEMSINCSDGRSASVQLCANSGLSTSSLKTKGNVKLTQ